MGTINSAFSLMSQALNADQQALNIVANNVANANTPGYTRETPNWQENKPLYVGGVSYGQGVTETGATSVRDRVLEARLGQQQQLASASGSRLTALTTLQALFTPDTGSASSKAGDIGSDITGFFNSFASLEANPTNNALRQGVLSTASILAGDISNAAASMNSQRSALDQEAGGVTSQVNSLTSAIAQLNGQIQTASPNADAGTLEDQRQHDLSQLSQLIGINQIKTENNGLAITTTSGQLLVSEGTSYQVTTGMVSGVTNFFVGNTNITQQLTTGGGSLGGYLTARDGDIPTALSSLDQLAYSVSTSINAQNNAGTDLNGVAGSVANLLNIFSQPTVVAGSAAAMSVVMTDPNQVAAAGAGQGTGDNSNAIAMASLANESLVQPVATTTFSVVQNLDAATLPGGTATGNVTVYDSLGASYNATVTYTKAGANTWGYSISMPETLTPDTSNANQVSYSFGSGETVNPGANLTITGNKAGGGTATIVAPVVTAGEAVGTAGPPATGYVAALDTALTAAGIVGVTVTNTGGVLTITGATGTAGSVIADPVASANATGTLTFDPVTGNLVNPAADVNGITFAGLSDGAATLNLDWGLFATNGKSTISQSAAVSAQTGQSQNGFAGLANGQTPINFYSSFVSTLGSTVSSVETANAAENASVTQLQSQNNALTGVNLNDEASAMTTLERSYQAASQVFAMLNNIMASALNLGQQTPVS